MARKKRSRPAQQNNAQRKSSNVRIIAGQWRGRKLAFASDVQGLRPTPDRTRETLFNWLQGELYQARCLDLFAGSGALGFEALSRGAGQVTFVEKHSRVAVQLEENAALLPVNNKRANVVHTDAINFLQIASDHSTLPYDLIFLDPPFHQRILPDILRLIEQYALLAKLGMLYIEYEVEEATGINNVMKASHFVLHKQNKAGQVVSALYKLSK